MTLTRQERIFLLKLARSAIEAELAGRALELPLVSSPGLMERRGAFVTLHKHGQLRGCIGNFVSEKPLYETVADMAIAAAFQDPRFKPLEPSELPEIDIEISALTPLRPVSSPEEIEVGKHGIYLINGPYHGVLLPQVATEYGWDRYTFLDQTCIKAGMMPGCWKDPNTQILVFSAEVFGEKSEGLL
ncbi:MAG: AmmeMemoRadiSam system protein A [Thermodesulfobacteria bacterium]|nr:AmmeMemoRadiSam system protein A [Thermodesulfobacteriota bacterium]